MKVLIAEDDPISGLVLERTLQRWGYEIIRAKDGEEAWELYSAEPYPLVITDWMMPRADGLELCRRIRKSSSGRYTYVILLTAKSQKSELVEGMNTGADDFITKPFDSAELYARLRAGERVIDLEASLTAGHQAIENANIQLRRSIDHQHLINRLLRSLTSSLEIETILSEASEPLRQLFGASRSIIRLVDRSTKTLTIVSENCAKNVSSMEHMSFPIETGGDEAEASYNSSWVASDLSQSMLTDHRLSTKILADGFDVKSILSEPLIQQDEWFGDIGLHQCDVTRTWSNTEIQLLNTISQQISVVVANAKLHHKVQEQSVRDALSGLHNRRYFDETFALECERASRYNQQLSLVIVDLDFLKRINDDLGHLAGDEAIRKTGAILSTQSRRVDIATRFGGEEFALILPQTPLDGAAAAAEHWCQAINQCLIGDIRLSASIGVASFPNHGDKPELLLQAADTALYQAKKEGRNRVCKASIMEIMEASHS
jgi:two-component system, cell cycle response regulator